MNIYYIYIYIYVYILYISYVYIYIYICICISDTVYRVIAIGKELSKKIAESLIKADKIGDEMHLPVVKGLSYKRKSRHFDPNKKVNLGLGLRKTKKIRIKNKQHLFSLFVIYLCADNFVGPSPLAILVKNENETLKISFEWKHKEANARMIFHVLQQKTNVLVCSKDTDVLVLIVFFMLLIKLMRSRR